MDWNKMTQRLFFWKTEGTDAGTLKNMNMLKDDNPITKVNLSILKQQESLSKHFKEIDDIKDFYLSEMMISRIIDDALNPIGGEDEIFKVTVKNDDGSVNEIATQEINNFKKEFNIEKIITDISPDILAYGPHYLRLDVNTIDSDKTLKGIVNIHDDVDPKNIIPVWRDNRIIYYNVIKDGKIIREPAYKYAFFGYSTSRKKVKIELNDEDVVYFRTAEGILRPVLQNLKTLYLLEGLVYINLIKKASKQDILGVNIPDSVKPDEAVQIAKTYEKLVNKSINSIEFNFDEVKETLEQILQHTNTIKVVPNWSDKGQVEKIDFGVFDDLDDLFEKIEDTRNIILQTNGFPPSVFENDVSRMDLIQNSVRYSKKLKTFQSSIKNSLAQLFLIHLVNCGYDVNMKNIEVQFLNVVNLNDLEKIEFLNMTIDMMSNINEFVQSFAENADDLGVNVDQTVIIDFYNKTFEKMFGKTIFKLQNQEHSEK